MKKKSLPLVSLIVIVLLFQAACQIGIPTAEGPTPTPQPAPTQVLPTATDLPIPTLERPTPVALTATAEPTAASILEQIGIAKSEEFRSSLKGMDNLYGDGRASERIVAVLASVPLGEELLVKRWK